MRMPRRRRFTARTADRHELYQLAVQSADLDAAFYARWFLKFTGRPLRVLREDFCGTAAMACEHVKRHRDNRAIGVDMHWPTLAWGRIHNVKQLLDEEQQTRLLLLQKNVLDVRRPLADAIAALNFSYSVFKTRRELAAYVKNCYASLTPGGLLFFDAWGGPDAMQQKIDRHRREGFVYLWDQQRHDPIRNEISCAIHFEFPDGTRMREAFVYDWRLWTLAELRELFDEAGFQDIEVLWECGDSKTGRGTGVFRKTAVADMDEAWISIVVGRKPK